MLVLAEASLYSPSQAPISSRVRCLAASSLSVSGGSYVCEVHLTAMYVLSLETASYRVDKPPTNPVHLGPRQRSDEPEIYTDPTKKQIMEQLHAVFEPNTPSLTVAIRADDQCSRLFGNCHGGNYQRGRSE